jgi:HK97 family phage major capsid protein
MAFESWKPEVIAADVQHQLQKALVYGQEGVINRNYEGEVQFAKSVRIVGVGSVTVRNYAQGSDMTDPETILDTDLEMTIDYDKYFNFKVSNKDQAQTKIDIMAENNKEAAYAVRDAIDQTIAALYTDASSSNLVGSDSSAKTPNLTQGDASNVYNLIEDCGVALSDSKVPAEGRWMVVPPRFAGLIRKDLKLTASMAGNPALQGAVLNGAVAKIGGFSILESHNVPIVSSTKYKILFGTNKAITFASQVQDIRILDMEKQFAKKVDGEYVFGCKVVRPEYLGVMTVSF